MEELFSPRYQWLWTAVLGVALFFPTRRLIWVVSVRREERKTGQTTSEERRQSLKRRAGVTAALLCFVFSIFYVQILFGNLYGPR